MKLQWKELLLAFLIAVGIWYLVSGSEKVESQIEARVDYRGLPQGLTVRRGMIGKVSVRIRVSVGMLHSLSNREFSFFMDLSSIKKGENVLPINISYLALPGGAEVIDIVPSRIVLEADTLESKMVPLLVEVRGTLPVDYTVDTSVTPGEVKISGPTTEVKKIRHITIPMTVESSITPGNSESRHIVPLPAGLDCSPSEIKVGMHIGIKRKLVQVTRLVNASVPEQFSLYMRPDKVQISLAVPESLAGSLSSEGNIQAYVRLERFEPGTYSLPVQVTLQDNIELVKIEPATISISVEQKRSTSMRAQPEKESPGK
ncbi:MAG: hypothetical protein LBD42_09065 [Desulfovibrio sp.]|jgi:YbbR domain-containing protein|nr:hypothetical protein [Desulfovibrio sp.]